MRNALREITRVHRRVAAPQRFVKIPIPMSMPIQFALARNGSVISSKMAAVFVVKADSPAISAIVVGHLCAFERRQSMHIR
jgi:hypothetical protein